MIDYFLLSATVSARAYPRKPLEHASAHDDVVTSVVLTPELTIEIREGVVLNECIGPLSPVDQRLQECSHKFLPIEARVVYYLFA